MMRIPVFTAVLCLTGCGGGDGALHRKDRTVGDEGGVLTGWIGSMMRIPVFTAVLCLTGCGGRTGPMQHETRSIERDSSETMIIELRMGAGTLRLSGGSPNWMQGNFAYNVPS